MPTPRRARGGGESQATRYSGDTFAAQAAQQGATADTLTAIAAGWRCWGASADVWLAILNGELLARKPLP